MEAKPNLKKFRLTFRGYDVDEVDAYIEKTEKLEESLNEQKARIFELLDQNEKLRKEAEELRRKQDNISSALLEATKKADQIVSEAKGLADAEIERVRLFRSKWEYFAEKMLSELAPRQKLLYEKLSRRIDETLNKFCRETAENDSRVSGFEEAENKVDKLKSDANETLRLVEAAEKSADEGGKVVHAIELDEVYNTTESLEDLLSELG